MNTHTVDLSHIDAALAALGRVLESHGASCVCQACQALAGAVEEAEALTVVLAYVRALADNGNAIAWRALKELEQVH